ncbi:MAG: NfeD family protein [Pseudomonadales bacterium]
MELNLLYWHWLVLGMGLIMIEIVLPSFVSLWFGAGALLVGVLLLFLPELPIWLQLLIWTIASVAFTGLWFKYLKPKSIDKTKAGLSREAIVGQTAQVISTPLENKRGELRFSTPIMGSEEWSFICDQPVAVGDRVVVQDVSGNTLIVTKK